MAEKTRNSNDGTALLKEGVRLLESGDVAAAIANFSRVIETEPSRAAAYRLRGSAQLRKRAYKSAISDLNKAIKLTPKDAVAHYLRGCARQLSMRYRRRLPGNSSTAWRASTLEQRQPTRKLRGNV